MKWSPRENTEKLWGLVRTALVIPAARSLAGELFEALALNRIAPAVKNPTLYTFKVKRLFSHNTSSRAHSIRIVDFLQPSFGASWEPLRPTSAASSSSFFSSASFSSSASLVAADDFSDCPPELKKRKMDQAAQKGFPDLFKTLPDKLDPALGCIIFDNLEELKSKLRPRVLFTPSYRNLAAADRFILQTQSFKAQSRSRSHATAS